MKVVPPYEITPSNLTSNVPENDYAEWTAGTYPQGTRKIIAAQHAIYEVLATTTADSPLDGIAKAVPTWLVVGPTNRWKMFNKRAGNTWMIGTFTSNPNTIDVTVHATKRTNSIGLVGVKASSVQIIMTVSGAEVYNQTISMSTKAGGSWYQYYFGPFKIRNNLAEFDLPPYANADIRVIISAPGSTAQVGMMVVGWAKEIGWARWGTSLGSESYSNVKEDDFGNVTITPRGKRRFVDFDIAMYANQVSTALQILEPLGDTAALYVGSETIDSTIIVGRFDRLALTLPNVAISEYSLEVRSLI